MSFQRIGGAVMGLDKAVPVIQKANGAIDAANQSLATIEMERVSLIETAMQADPSDATKLTKAAEALRHKRLSALMQATKIPSMKAAAQVAIRAAAAAAVESHRQALETHTAQLREAAKLAGYQENDRQWVSMMTGDRTLNNVKRFMAEDKLTANNYHAMTPDDDAAMADVQRQIGMMLQ